MALIDENKSQNKKRHIIEYSNDTQSEEYINDTLRCGPLYCTLSGAGRKCTDKRNNAAKPSDDAVEEMRDWSIEAKV